MLFKTTAWKHQQEALEFCFDRIHSLLHMGMGTGKSKVVVDLVVNKEHQSVLILCPVSVMNVWPREFDRHAAKPVHVLVLNKGSVAEKVKRAQQFVERNKPAVVVINYESAWRPEFAEWARNKQPPWDLVVLDESQRIKSPTGKASKFCDRLRVNARQRLCLTGTPMPHSPLDIFAQLRFLNPQVFGKWYTHFRAQYAVTNPMFPSQVSKWINQDELAAKVATVTYQVGSEVLDLPPVLHEEIPVELCPKAMKAYRDLEEDLIAEVDLGTISVANALVKLLRLQQLTGGAVQLDDGALVEVDTAKADALLDLAEDIPATEPIVVFCRFRRDLATVAKVAKALERRYGELSGERKDLTDKAEMPADVDMMGVQVQSGGVGIDLTRAAYVIYFSLGYSLGDYLQSLARSHRPGQDRTVRYYHLVATGTVDQAVYGALEKRKAVVEYVLENYKKREVMNV